MSLRFPTILPAWQYGDPANIAQFTAPPAVRVVMVPANDPQHVHGKRHRIWDRYYRQARRLHIQRLIRGK